MDEHQIIIKQGVEPEMIVSEDGTPEYYQRVIYNGQEMLMKIPAENLVTEPAPVAEPQPETAETTNYVTEAEPQAETTNYVTEAEAQPESTENSNYVTYVLPSGQVVTVDQNEVSHLNMDQTQVAELQGGNVVYMNADDVPAEAAAPVEETQPSAENQQVLQENQAAPVPEEQPVEAPLVMNLPEDTNTSTQTSQSNTPNSAGDFKTKEDITTKLPTNTNISNKRKFDDGDTSAINVKQHPKIIIRTDIGRKLTDSSEPPKKVQRLEIKVGGRDSNVASETLSDSAMIEQGLALASSLVKLKSTNLSALNMLTDKLKQLKNVDKSTMGNSNMRQVLEGIVGKLKQYKETVDKKEMQFNSMNKKPVKPTIRIRGASSSGFEFEPPEIVSNIGLVAGKKKVYSQPETEPVHDSVSRLEPSNIAAESPAPTVTNDLPESSPTPTNTESENVTEEPAKPAAEESKPEISTTETSTTNVATSKPYSYTKQTIKTGNSQVTVLRTTKNELAQLLQDLSKQQSSHKVYTVHLQSNSKSFIENLPNMFKGPNKPNVTVHMVNGNEHREAVKEHLAGNKINVPSTSSSENPEIQTIPLETIPRIPREAVQQVQHVPMETVQQVPLEKLQHVPIETVQQGSSAPKENVVQYAVPDHISQQVTGSSELVSSPVADAGSVPQQAAGNEVPTSVTVMTDTGQPITFSASCQLSDIRQLASASLNSGTDAALDPKLSLRSLLSGATFRGGKSRGRGRPKKTYMVQPNPSIAPRSTNLLDSSPVKAKVSFELEQLLKDMKNTQDVIKCNDSLRMPNEQTQTVYQVSENVSQPTQIVYQTDETGQQVVYQTDAKTGQQVQVVYQNSDGTTQGTQVVYQNNENTPQGTQIVYQNNESTPQGTQIVYQNSDGSTQETQVIYQNNENTAEGAQTVYQTPDSTQQVVYQTGENGQIVYQMGENAADSTQRTESSDTQSFTNSSGQKGQYVMTQDGLQYVLPSAEGTASEVTPPGGQVQEQAQIVSEQPQVDSTTDGQVQYKYVDANGQEIQGDVTQVVGPDGQIQYVMQAQVGQSAEETSSNQNEAQTAATNEQQYTPPNQIPESLEVTNQEAASVPQATEDPAQTNQNAESYAANEDVKYIISETGELQYIVPKEVESVATNCGEQQYLITANEDRQFVIPTGHEVQYITTANGEVQCLVPNNPENPAAAEATAPSEGSENQQHPTAPVLEQPATDSGQNLEAQQIQAGEEVKQQVYYGTEPGVQYVTSTDQEVKYYTNQEQEPAAANHSTVNVANQEAVSISNQEEVPGTPVTTTVDGSQQQAQGYVMPDGDVPDIANVQDV